MGLRNKLVFGEDRGDGFAGVHEDIILAAITSLEHNVGVWYNNFLLPSKEWSSDIDIGVLPCFRK